MIRVHHSDGSCTAPPPGRYFVAMGLVVWASSSPCSETAPALRPPVPRSMARIHGLITKSAPCARPAHEKCAPRAPRPPSSPGLGGGHLLNRGRRGAATRVEDI